MYYSRLLESKVRESLNENPVAAILGPRQCGKSTMAKNILKGFAGSVYLDLQKPADLAKLTDPEDLFGEFGAEGAHGIFEKNSGLEKAGARVFLGVCDVCFHFKKLLLDRDG